MNLNNAIRVILVEDNQQFRSRFENLINDSDSCTVVGTAVNGAEGLELIKHCDYDVLLCDLGLPDFSGLDVIRASSLENPQSDIMVISLFCDWNAINESLLAGAKGYILKDALPEDFIPLIEDLRAGNSPLSPKIARILLANFNNEKSVECSPLSNREALVLKLAASGMPIKVIAKELGLSMHTVSGYTKSIYQKLGVNSKIQAVSLANSKGWVKW